MPNVQNVEIIKGQTFYRKVTWKINNVPVDLTDATARMDFREDYDDEDVILSLTSDPGGGLTIDELGGAVEIQITGEITALIGSMSLVFDLKVSNVTTVPNQPEKYLFQGQASIFPSVTP